MGVFQMGVFQMELVQRYKENGFITVRELSKLFGISYMGMRRVLEYNKFPADKEVKRGTKTFYLYNKEKVLQLLAGVGYIPVSEQMVEK